MWPDRSQYLGLAPGRWAFASAAWQGYRTTTEVASTRLAASADLGEGARSPPAGRSVANNHVARGRCRLALFALCAAEGAAGTSRYLADRAARRRVAADRVAARRSRADQVLVCHFARGYRLRTFGGCRKVAMADRARLSGAEAATRAW